MNYIHVFWYFCFCRLTELCSGREVSVGPALINREKIGFWIDMATIPHPNDPIKLGNSYRVSRFSFYAKKPGKISIQLWRRTGRDKEYRCMATTRLYQAKIKGIHHVRPFSPVTVEDGDVVGFYTPKFHVIPYDDTSCKGKPTMCILHPKEHQLSPGSVLRFNERAVQVCSKYSIQVTVEIPSVTVVPPPRMLHDILKIWWVRAAEDQRLRKEFLHAHATSRSACAATCTQEPWCKSFAFSDPSDTCWIENKKLNEEKEVHKQEKGVDYYIIRE